MDIQIQEAQWMANKINWKKSTPRHIITKLSTGKDKENFESSKRKTTCHICSNLHETINGFLSRNFADYKESDGIFTLLKEKNPPTKNTIPGKTIKNEERERVCQTKEKKKKKLREFINRLALHEMLKWIVGLKWKDNK